MLLFLIKLLFMTFMTGIAVVNIISTIDSIIFSDMTIICNNFFTSLYLYCCCFIVNIAGNFITKVIVVYIIILLSLQ